MRRQFYEIRNAIMESLKKRPMGMFEISADTKTSIGTTKRHVEHLEKIGVIRKGVFRDDELWTLTKEG